MIPMDDSIQQTDFPRLSYITYPVVNAPDGSSILTYTCRQRCMCKSCHEDASVPVLKDPCGRRFAEIEENPESYAPVIITASNSSDSFPPCPYFATRDETEKKNMRRHRRTSNLHPR